MTRADCLSDLVARARRYRLSPAERVRLDEHLSFCPSCRREQQVGADFDAIGGLQAGDDVLISALATRSVGRIHGRLAPRPRLRSLSMAAALACVLVSAGAGAGVLLHSRRSPPRVAQPVSSDVQPAAAVRPRPSVAPPAAEVADLSRPQPIAVPVNPKPLRSAHAAASPRTSPAVDAVAETASSLFADANRERRQAHAEAAIALYDQLQGRYPASQEALVAHVSLGRLLLERGAWSDGLSQLDQYLSASPHGLLAPEALFGKAQALQGLRRHDDERDTWARLLTRFADSVYAGQARRRLEDLR